MARRPRGTMTMPISNARAVTIPVVSGVFFRDRMLRAAAVALVVQMAAAGTLVQPAAAQAPACKPGKDNELNTQICSLIGQTPRPPTLDGQDLVAAGVITNRLAAQQLGKALFWDIEVGSDGQACASCHYHAGADIRITNQVDPGINANPPDLSFGTRVNGAPTGPNQTLSARDFPFRQLVDINDRNSDAIYDSNDRFSSQGTYAGDFVRPQPLPLTPTLKSIFHAGDTCADTYDSVNNPFHSNGLIRRKVEPRQTPTAINAVFNVRQFWDGRANNRFNGVDPFGARTFQPPQSTPAGVVGNPAAAGSGVLTYDHPGLVLTQPLIKNSSLASQAVGPPGSNFEMSCSGRGFRDIGHKLMSQPALAMQAVSPTDSLFSLTPGLVSTGGPGLTATYYQLITGAFAPKYWAASQRVTVDPATGAITPDDANGFLQVEQHFAFFFGLAVQEYESLLVSDPSPFDTGIGFTDAAAAGEKVFKGDKAGCSNCHFGPLFSAATRTQQLAPGDELSEHMVMGDGGAALYDHGFYNIGVRPTFEDVGVGGKDAYGFDLSFTRQYKWRLLGSNQLKPDAFKVDPCNFV